MAWVKEIFRQIFTDRAERGFVVMVNSYDEVITQAALYDLEKELVEKLAQKYIEVYGDAVLKHIQEKTIEAKVIQKVIENLRKEIKGDKK